MNSQFEAVLSRLVVVDNGPPKEVHGLISRTCEYVTYILQQGILRCHYVKDIEMIGVGPM